MELNLTTPAVLLSTISLLLLAFTNRFLTIATLIRDLHRRYLDNGDRLLLSQLQMLQFRVRLIREMQTLGVLSLFCCVLSMFLLFLELRLPATYAFGAGLLLLLGSLAISTREIYISTQALSVELSDIETLN
jgi:hypothetical protein